MFNLHFGFLHIMIKCTGYPKPLSDYGGPEESIRDTRI